MCLQCASLRVGNVDSQRGRQEETIGIRDEMLPSDSKNQLEGYGEERGYPKEDIQGKNYHRHDQEKEIRIIRSHLQNGGYETDQTHPFLENGWKVSKRTTLQGVAG